MDVLTIGTSAIVSTLSTICIMFLLYSRWILPYLTNLTNSVPIQCREMLGPYVDEQMQKVGDLVNSKVDEIRTTVNKTSARFQRTVNQAQEYLDGMGIDLEDESAVETAKERVANRYGLDVAMQVFADVLTSLKRPKEEPKKAPIADGWE